MKQRARGTVPWLYFLAILGVVSQKSQRTVPLAHPPGSPGRNSGHCAAAPGPLEVVAPAGSVDIEDFPCKVQVFVKPGLHGVRVDFVQGDTAGAHLGLIEAAGAADVEL